MATFAEVSGELKTGRMLHRRRWQAGTVMFVADEELVCQTTEGRTAGKAYRWDLGWDDINATDWTVA